MIALPKNNRDELRIERTNYNGHDLIQLRVWYDAGNGEYRPGKQGVAFRVNMLPDVTGALASLLDEEEAA